MVTVQLLEHAWRRSSKELEDTSDFDPQIVESGQGIQFQLARGDINMVCHVVVRRAVSVSRYSPVQALATAVYFSAINRVHMRVGGRYPYNSTTEDVYAVLPRLSNQERTCPSAVTHTRVGPLTLERQEWMRPATGRVWREMDLAGVEEGGRWDRQRRQI